MRLRKPAWLVVLIVLSLAGCQGLGLSGGTPVPATPSPETSGAPASESTPVSESTRMALMTPQPAGMVTLRVWLPAEFDPDSGTPAGNLLKARLAQFSVENPGVSIEVRLKALEGAGGLLESLVTTSAAAPLALPDLIALPRPLLESAALKGLIYPYDQLSLAQVGEDWYPYAQQLAYLQTTLFGLPFAGDALALTYRPAAMSAPADWGSLLSSQAVLVFPAADPNAYLTLALYLAQGGELQDEQGRPLLEEGPLLGVLEYYQQAAQVNLMPFWLTQSETDDQAWATFTSEQNALLVTWLTHHLREGRTASGLALAPLPAWEGSNFTLATGWNWALASPDPLRRELGARLAEYLVDDTFLAEWTQTAGYLPTRSAALDGWNDGDLRAALAQIASSAQLAPPTEVLTSLGPLLEQATVTVLKEENTPSAAVQAALEQLYAP